MLNLQHPSLFRQQAYIDGHWIDGKDTFPVHNPFDNQLIIRVANMGAEDTQKAIDAAARAFPAWRDRTAEERSDIIRKWYELQLAHADELAQILTLEQGKPLPEAKGEILYGASFVKWFAEEARRVYGDTIPGHARDKRIVVIKQPVGVVAAITPWNFPNAMITRKVAPALAAGCTVIIKPPSATPLSALALAALGEEAGIPPGVLNVVPTNNSKAVGEELTSNTRVRKLSFTGSTAVGKKLIAQCAETVKKVSMELGGNAPFIVFDDADIDAAVEGAIAAKFRNAGQTCVCANRIYAQKGIYEKFTQKLNAAVQALKVGNGMEEGVEIGPLINEEALQFVEAVVADAVEKGAELLSGGKRLAANKNCFQPTVLSHVTREMAVHSEEIFGPIAPVFAFETEEEAIEMANDTPFGLAAYFYGTHYARIWRVAEALEYGMVGINTGMISTTVAPFGGIKESGYGREGSKYGLEDFLEIKYLCWGSIDK